MPVLLVLCIDVEIVENAAAYGVGVDDAPRRHRPPPDPDDMLQEHYSTYSGLNKPCLSTPPVSGKNQRALVLFIYQLMTPRPRQTLYHRSSQELGSTHFFRERRDRLALLKLAPAERALERGDDHHSRGEDRAPNNRNYFFESRDQLWLLPNQMPCDVGENRGRISRRGQRGCCCEIRDALRTVRRQSRYFQKISSEIPTALTQCFIREFVSLLRPRRFLGPRCFPHDTS